MEINIAEYRITNHANIKYIKYLYSPIGCNIFILLPETTIYKIFGIYSFDLSSITLFLL